MKKPQTTRRIVTLFAAYVVALQALLLPLSVAAGSPFVGSLCTSHTAPAGHSSGGDNGCPCAAGCGMQCCSHVFILPGSIADGPRTISVYRVEQPVSLVSIQRSSYRTPCIPRAPPLSA